MNIVGNKAKFNEVNKPEIRILCLLAGLCKSTKRRYCYPSQAWLVAKLGEWYGVTMSRRTINRHLRSLERQGFINRQRRHTKSKSGSLSLHSTLYTLRRTATKIINLLTRSAKFCMAITGPTNPINAMTIPAHNQLLCNRVINRDKETSRKTARSPESTQIMNEALSSLKAILS